eukprot:c34657_g1_i1.p1 GENE.c34657_g1_i1~~c34657_g1_i1.p1  ORF type:complete len:146 (-),score=21.79 c34657_g1_i1:257-670(-)
MAGTHTHILHVIDYEAWAAFVASGAELFTEPSLATEGFIHFSATTEQANAVVNAFYRCPRPIVLSVKLDAIAPSSEVRWEPPAHPEIHDTSVALPAASELLPHVYGPVARSAIVGFYEFAIGADGRKAMVESVLIPI